jgi:hypothetical protein
LGVTVRQCLRVVTMPTLLATLAAVVAHAWGEPELVDGATATAAATPWLTLPLFVAAAGCSLAAAQAWPTFTQRRDGADTVRRIARGPFGGRGAVIAGALVAQLLLSLPLAVALTAWFEAPVDARRHRPADVPSMPILEEPGQSLAFELRPPMRAGQILLRPRASLPTGPDPTLLELTSGGERLHDTPIAFDESLELVRVPLDGRQLGTFELTWTAGHVPLLFAAGSVVVVDAEPLPRWANAVLLGLLAAGTSLLTLLLAALIGAGSGWPTVASAIGATQFVLWIGGVGPIDDAILAVLRGQWLW